jgi:hypothetical protein
MMAQLFSIDQTEGQKESMADPQVLLELAFARFVEARISVGGAKYGMLGIWVGPRSDDDSKQENGSGSSPLQRAEMACARWNRAYRHLPNPYEPIIEFLRAGGSFLRWENNILDVEFPDGQKAGIPLATFVSRANNALQTGR